jgi:hypothetical protein
MSRWCVGVLLAAAAPAYAAPVELVGTLELSYFPGVPFQVDLVAGQGGTLQGSYTYAYGWGPIFGHWSRLSDGMYRVELDSFGVIVDSPAGGCLVGSTQQPTPPEQILVGWPAMSTFSWDLCVVP